MARELNEIVKDLQNAIDDVQNAKQVEEEARDAYSKASVEHRNAQDKAAALKQEMEAIFNAFVPTDSTGRVRTSN